ncbi:hypothetical protein Fmac_009149 [Flemingia macrophylla]|uniref:Uncharacterized protein n=1 Tax=Flemingia macrophylla TaxID=520843 RepID=A0ABD1MZE4_9FABA
MVEKLTDKSLLRHSTEPYMRFSLHMAPRSIILKSLDPFPSSVRESPPLLLFRSEK